MGKDCKDMICPPGQFCYHISNLCVDFLDCSRYNREKGQNPAESPLQCGPCIKGYEFETLATGQEPRSCKLVEMGNSGESDTWYGTIPIVVIILIVMALISALILCKRYCSSFFKRIRSIRIFKLNDSASDIPPKVTNNVIAVASAPLEEEKPFVGSAEKGCTPDNNNKRIIQTNEYQNTIPYSYRHIPSYGLNNSNNDSNSNDPYMRSRQVATVEIPENQHDENIQTSSQNDPFNDNDNLSNHHDDDSDTIDSASEPSNKNNRRPSNLIISQMVRQNIIINMNEDN